MKLYIPQLLLLTALLPVPLIAAEADEAAQIDFFEKKIRPLLVDKCYNCHSANTNAKGGLRVDDRRGLVDGGNRGAAIVLGNPDDSVLIQAVRYQDKDLQMPPQQQLDAEQIALLEQWIKEGAVWPNEEVSIEIGKPNARYDEVRKNHWAWKELKAVLPLEVKQPDWARSEIDRFVLARLEERGLTPSDDADRVSLIRRVTFDLTGLPPTPAEIDAFAADDSAEAFAKVVDRLLASRGFGERWGRHWLDVARYGESTGSSRNVPYPHAWRYRDYVIAAFNNDKPYDQFIREQIAGDLLPAGSEEQRIEQIIATGFLALGVKDVNQRFKARFVMDNIDEQIDTVSRSFLALTASCARCHDHKFDPIPTADYYALAGVFESTDLCAGVRNKMGGGGLDYYDVKALLQIGEQTAPTADQDEKIAAAKRALEEAKERFQALKDSPEGLEKAPNGKPKRQVARNRMNKLQAELNALSDPSASGNVALGVREGKVADTDIRVRGEAEKHGPSVPRGFLSLINVSSAPAIDPSQSGRLELAQWLTSAENPLTPRVMVNRIWQHLLGQGLVTSVDNFGVTGDTPSHPELLDHLAAQFVREGWSIKRLVRSVVLSRSYQLSSAASPENVAIDPANRLIWRHSPRRLSAEEIRDATLVASGKLDPAPISASPAKELKVVEIRNNGPEARHLEEHARASLHRSVYLPLLRGLTPTSLEVFDFAEQGMVTGSRETTTVAPQALYLLNDPFVRKQSLALAERLLAATDADDAKRIEMAYRLTLGRPASSAELARATTYVANYEAAYLQAADPQPEVKPETVAVVETPAETPAKPAKPIDPDEVLTPDEPVKEEVIQAGSAQTAAWASLCQALLGSAEFRYLK